MPQPFSVGKSLITLLKKVPEGGASKHNLQQEKESIGKWSRGNRTGISIISFPLRKSTRMLHGEPYEINPTEKAIRNWPR